MCQRIQTVSQRWISGPMPTSTKPSEVCRLRHSRHQVPLDQVGQRGVLRSAERAVDYFAKSHGYSTSHILIWSSPGQCAEPNRSSWRSNRPHRSADRRTPR
ncbi:hypothetical protein M0R45_028233 [Rubus argutus]|uniref:Uncharacterized protein n=1 Tax=Rubus argutus TaxID=59490 RepID=A0AAW1W587_RUBAR